jgi:hypothetical protein
VKQAQSNPLVRELSREETTEAHPSEDVLTAFAENTLLGRERLEVVEHLSRCGSCREVLSLTTAAAPEALVPAKPLVLVPRPRSRVWLPWAVAAAGLIVVSSAVLLYERGAQVGEGPRGTAAVATTTETTPSPEVQGSQGVASGEGQSRPPVSLAAPQSPALTSGLADGAGVRAHWRINEAGRVERSVDGTTWQAAMPGNQAKMHVIWVSGRDVWIGGDGLSLFRSGDEGATWKLASLPNKDRAAHTITHSFSERSIGHGASRRGRAMEHC